MASTLHLTIAGTLAVHLIAAVVVDALGVTHKRAPRPPPPRVSLVDVDVRALRPRPVEPPPEPPPTTPAPAAPVPPTAQVAPRTSPRPTTRRVATAAKPAPATTTDTTAPPQPGGGTGPVYRMDNLGVPGRGAAVATGQPTGGHGDGGSGGGRGGGTGPGMGSGETRPVSVASIKTPARPVGDFDYFDAKKDYPAEARALGVEGVIKAKLVVDADGKVTSAKLINRLGHGLDELALTRARALRFAAARDDRDQPVASIVVWEFTFTLPP